MTVAVGVEAQYINGYVADSDTGQPLKGVAVSVIGTNVSAESDSIGFWRLPVPAGRYSVRLQLLGYKSVIVSDVSVSAGKQRDLSVSMKELLTVLDEIVITPDSRSYGAVSRMQINPAELSHIPGHAGDPIRMLTAMPGINNTGDDRNDLIVRGNSATGVLWRIEGVEVFNPSHYALSGSGGGTLSLLNKNVLGTSAFYAGAFPAEFGNVYSGVFDANFREGNAEKYEFSAEIHNLALNAVAEGPVPIRNRKSSFVAGFRQSTIPLFDIINKKYREMLGATPVFTDFSFKLTSRNRTGAKTVVWGLTGKSVLDLPANTGSNATPQDIVAETVNVSSGMSHQFFIGDKVNIKATLGVSFLKTDNGMFSDWYTNQLIDKSKSAGAGISVDMKPNKKNVVKGGINIRFMDLNIEKNVGSNYYSYTTGKNVTTVNAFTEWKHYFDSKWSMTSGIHYFTFSLNRHYRVEPRLSMAYSLNDVRFELAAGEYSRQNPIGLYMARATDYYDEGRKLFPNLNLDFIKSRQAVFAFSGKLFRNMNFKTELYYQHHYDVAIAEYSYNQYNEMYLYSSALNAAYYTEDIDETDIRYDNSGKGYSKGVEGMIYCDDVHGFSMNLSATLFESKTYTRKGWFNSLFNGSFMLKAFAGKQFKLNSSLTLRTDVAMYWSGGRRYTPVDCDASYAEYFYINESDRYVLYPIVRDYSQYLEKQNPDYFRLDFKTSLIINLKSTTHIIALDIRNLTNYKNIYENYTYYENRQLVNEAIYQAPGIPVVSYQILFGSKKGSKQ
jgi:hypothetical protein